MQVGDSDKAKSLKREKLGTHTVLTDSPCDVSTLGRAGLNTKLSQQFMKPAIPARSFSMSV